jgi:hypothetical protein
VAGSSPDLELDAPDLDDVIRFKEDVGLYSSLPGGVRKESRGREEAVQEVITS